MTIALIVVIVLLIAALPITWRAAIANKTKQDAAKIGTLRKRQEV
jgi:hypothetical protein